MRNCINREIQSKIGYFIKKVRLSSGWSQDDLAEQLGYKGRFIQRLEAGHCSLSLLDFVKIIRITKTINNYTFQNLLNFDKEKPVPRFLWNRYLRSEIIDFDYISYNFSDGDQKFFEFVFYTPEISDYSLTEVAKQKSFIHFINKSQSFKTHAIYRVLKIMTRKEAIDEHQNLYVCRFYVKESLQDTVPTSSNLQEVIDSI